MSVIGMRVSGSGNETMVAIAGSLQPGAVTAGNYDDVLLSPTDPVTSGLCILDGHAFVDISSFTAGGGTVSVGIVLVPNASLPVPNFDAYTIGTIASAQAAAAEANVHLPVTAAAGTGLPTTLTGLVAGLPAVVGNPWFIPTLRIVISVGITTAPVCRYVVFLRCAGHKGT